MRGICFTEKRREEKRREEKTTEEERRGEERRGEERRTEKKREEKRRGEEVSRGQDTKKHKKKRKKTRRGEVKKRGEKRRQNGGTLLRHLIPLSLQQSMERSKVAFTVALAFRLLLGLLELCALSSSAQ